MTCAVAEVAVNERLREYNQEMKEKMGWTADLNPYEYHFERGLYFHEVYDNLLCGSQPSSQADVEKLKRDVGVTAILNLQQDKDPRYWGINLHDIIHRAKQLGIRFVRTSVRDFDPDSLRHQLPEAVVKLQQLLSQGERVYVHCTAGLGRAPAVCIAWLYWYTDMDLDTSYKYLTSIRPCGPKRDSIRYATQDLMIQAEVSRNGHNGHYQDLNHLPQHTYAYVTPEEKIDIREFLQNKY